MRTKFFTYCEWNEFPSNIPEITLVRLINQHFSSDDSYFTETTVKVDKNGSPITKGDSIFRTTSLYILLEQRRQFTPLRTDVSSKKLICYTAWSDRISNITVPMDILLNSINEPEFGIGGDEPLILYLYKRFLTAEFVCICAI